ncbi:hypothetical protein ACH5RR_003013 [Cinchona calisaya]|uniref:Prolactin receptor n=1 Tax=Cinchona calisaya TaxID=153742 RepID=A0ABD3AU91_9GENT
MTKEKQKNNKEKSTVQMTKANEGLVWQPKKTVDVFPSQAESSGLILKEKDGILMLQSNPMVENPGKDVPHQSLSSQEDNPNSSSVPLMETLAN